MSETCPKCEALKKAARKVIEEIESNDRVQKSPWSNADDRYYSGAGLSQAIATLEKEMKN
jgi:hypothetical protein